MSSVPTINEEAAEAPNEQTGSVSTNDEVVSKKPENAQQPIPKKNTGTTAGNTVVNSPKGTAGRRKNSLRRLSREVPRLPSTFSALNEEADAKTKGKKKPVKKQQPSAFLAKPIKLGKLKNVDSKQVMINLRDHLIAEENYWENMWKCLKVSNLFIIVCIMGINLVQVLINLLGLSQDTVKVVSTCLPVVSSLLISFQNKFAWDDKSEISKKSVEFYKRMIKHVDGRIRLDEVGAKVTDVINLWNASLVYEMKEVPQAILPF